MLKDKSQRNRSNYPLIVSLTSYPPRFRTLHWTIKCLLTQSILPDQLILWVAVSDKKLLPLNVLRLQKEGLVIKYCDDIRSYKKIVPALKLYPDFYIVTADDDIFYYKNWLRDLIEESVSAPNSIISHRAHKIILTDCGMPLPYKNWEMQTADTKPSDLIFPTGVSGVLYPPGSLSDEAVKSDIFQTLCPTGDDIWLFWMARLNGFVSKKTKKSFTNYSWRSSQKNALWHENLAGDKNDIQIKAMMDRYGFPFVSGRSG